MEGAKLYSLISSLSEAQKAEVTEFVLSLKQKTQSEKKLKERTFGYAKGIFQLSPDFDEPIEDFKEYM